MSASFYGRTLKPGLCLRADVGGHRESGDQQAEQRSGRLGSPWLFHEARQGGMVKTGLLSGFGGVVNAVWLVSRQGSYRQRVRRDRPQRRNGTSHRVTTPERTKELRAPSAPARKRLHRCGTILVWL